MPELVSLHAVSLSQTPPQTPTTLASPATLPPLGSMPDEKFLSYNPSLAGRAVVVEILARPNDNREARQKLWKAYQAGGDSLQELGLAAQTLERIGLNWRQAKKPAEVLQAFRALPQDSIN